jgi:hypothetical protein
MQEPGLSIVALAKAAGSSRTATGERLRQLAARAIEKDPLADGVIPAFVVCARGSIWSPACDTLSPPAHATGGTILGAWMTEQELQHAIGALYADLTNLADIKAPDRPLHLAHYTSLEVLEKVMTNDEVWFSNPLLMNDYQEVRFGLSEAARIVGVLKDDVTIVQALNGKENVEKVLRAFSNALQGFDINHLFDVYVFCPRNTISKNSRTESFPCGAGTARTVRGRPSSSIRAS